MCKAWSLASFSSKLIRTASLLFVRHASLTVCSFQYSVFIRRNNRASNTRGSIIIHNALCLSERCQDIPELYHPGFDIFDIRSYQKLQDSARHHMRLSRFIVFLTALHNVATLVDLLKRKRIPSVPIATHQRSKEASRTYDKASRKGQTCANAIEKSSLIEGSRSSGVLFTSTGHKKNCRSIMMYCFVS